MSIANFTQPRGTARWAKRSGGLEDIINEIITQVNSLVLSGITADTFFSANTQSSAVDINLGTGTSNLQFITFTAASKKLIMPDADANLFDGYVCWVKNEGSYAFDIVADDGSTLIFSNLQPTGRVALLLKSDATSNGTWDVVQFSAGSGTEYGADTGSANAYVVTLSPVPSSYTAGMRVIMKAANSNTGASTINVNSLGVKSIKKNVSEALGLGDIIADEIVELLYDGTNFQKTSSGVSKTSVEELALIYGIIAG